MSTDYDAARAIGVPAPFVTIAENLTLKDTDDRAVGGEGVWAPQMRELLAVKALIDAGLGEQFAAASTIRKCDRPRPENVAVVPDVTKRTLGYTVTPLALGGQSDPNPPGPTAHPPAGPPPPVLQLLTGGGGQRRNQP